MKKVTWQSRLRMMIDESCCNNKRSNDEFEKSNLIPVGELELDGIRRLVEKLFVSADDPNAGAVLFTDGDEKKT